MVKFPDAVAEMQPQFQAAADRELAAYITAAERLDEAARVAGCVERAIAGELDPTGRLAISRYTRFSPPGLAELLTRKGRFDAADPGQREVLATAVGKTLALGWLFCCSPQAPVVTSRSERDIWSAWAPSLRERLDTVIDPKLARMIHNGGADVLIADLKRAGMTRLFGGSKLNQVAFHISQAGFYLRINQTDELPDEVFQRAVQIQDEIAPGGGARSLWEWEEYPV